jgi:hypothetical protein
MANSRHITFPDGTRGFDLAGKTFGMLTAISYAGRNKSGGSLFLFRCSCGLEKVKISNDVISGNTKSCGCLSKGKNKDIIGKTYGQLTAIKYVGIDKYNQSLFEFRCSCGQIKVNKGSDVTRGKIRSCGCLSKGKNKDIIGKTYGQLTAIKYAGKDKYGQSLFEFKCSCGQSKILKGSTITNGRQKSCGCLSAPLIPIVEGETYGRLTAIKPAGKNKFGQALYEFKCSCGQSKITQSYGVTKGTTKSCGCYHRENGSIIGSIVGLENCRGSTRNGWAVDDLELRSGFEVLMVLGFYKKGIAFEYEPKSFKLRDAFRYTPDFYLPETDSWIEVKGWMKEKDQEKVDLFRALGNKIKVYRLKDVEAFSGLSYSKLLRSGLYRPTNSQS